MDFTLCVGMEFDLEETMDSMPKQMRENNVDLTLILLNRRKIVDQEAECHASEEIPQPSDNPNVAVPLFVPRGGSSSHIRCERKDNLTLYFPTQSYYEMGILWSLVMPTRAKVIVKYNVDDIKRALASIPKR